MIIFFHYFELIQISGQFRCPEKDGQYEDEEQCDKYYNCVDGEAEEMLCDDGLVFDSFKRGSHKCDHQANVECEERTLLRKIIAIIIIFSYSIIIFLNDFICFMILIFNSIWFQHISFNDFSF